MLSWKQGAVNRSILRHHALSRKSNVTAEYTTKQSMNHEIYIAP